MALYRKYRPASFAEVIGQEHVTEPLSIALDSGRINHAYLFSGPRGCGKTSSARILARSLNCVEGPTSTPCGVCDSCIGLAPGGSGTLDVTELDAASHNGVDDMRELRDRAFYAPAESRYRVFIIDEAHMISTQGFNALLKIVEEPPEHLIFIFATTEPEKLLATIRSRTHNYPFRLLAPPAMRGLLESVIAGEGVAVEDAVYPLVVRAGGGSPRDSLSILDQLLAGAGPEGVTYQRALALLGVTDSALIDRAVEALGRHDQAGLFTVVDDVIDAGYDPRRFAMDLLDRFRDLLIVRVAPDAFERGLVDAPEGQRQLMVEQAGALGEATLTRCAALVNEGLAQMRGATAPRLLLEILCARMALPAAATTLEALAQRVEALEGGGGTRVSLPVAGAPAGVGAASAAPGSTAGSRTSAGGSARAQERPRGSVSSGAHAADNSRTQEGARGGSEAGGDTAARRSAAPAPSPSGAEPAERTAQAEGTAQAERAAELAREATEAAIASDAQDAADRQADPEPGVASTDAGGAYSSEDRLDDRMAASEDAADTGAAAVGSTHAVPNAGPVDRPDGGMDRAGDSGDDADSHTPGRAGAEAGTVADFDAQWDALAQDGGEADTDSGDEFDVGLAERAREIMNRRRAGSVSAPTAPQAEAGARAGNGGAERPAAAERPGAAPAGGSGAGRAGHTGAVPRSGSAERPAAAAQPSAGDAARSLRPGEWAQVLDAVKAADLSAWIALRDARVEVEASTEGTVHVTHHTGALANFVNREHNTAIYRAAAREVLGYDITVVANGLRDRGGAPARGVHGSPGSEAQSRNPHRGERPTERNSGRDAGQKAEHSGDQGAEQDSGRGGSRAAGQKAEHSADQGADLGTEQNAVQNSVQNADQNATPGAAPNVEPSAKPNAKHSAAQNPASTPPRAPMASDLQGANLQGARQSAEVRDTPPPTREATPPAQQRGPRSGQGSPAPTASHSFGGVPLPDEPPPDYEWDGPWDAPDLEDYPPPPDTEDYPPPPGVVGPARAGARNEAAASGPAGAAPATGAGAGRAGAAPSAPSERGGSSPSAGTPAGEGSSAPADGGRARSSRFTAPARGSSASAGPSSPAPARSGSARTQTAPDTVDELDEDSYLDQAASTTGERDRRTPLEVAGELLATHLGAERVR